MIVIRELFQNALKSCYENPDMEIKIAFDLNKEDEISVAYNDILRSEKTVKVSGEHYGEIKENLFTLGEKKGGYINIPELCFAFCAKKKLHKDSSKENLKRTLTVSVSDDSGTTVSYKISYFKKAVNKFVRFSQNERNVADFIYHEYDGLSYLIPFAVAAAKSQIISKVFLQKYNLFSTYELHADELPRKIKYEKLSAFFISSPEEFVTGDGSVIIDKIQRGVKDLIKTYSVYLVLDVCPISGQVRYGFRPRTYSFGFIRNFVTSSGLVFNLTDYFLNHVRIQFPEEENPAEYSSLKETAFSYSKKDVSESEHRSGKAYRTYILARREEMVRHLQGHSEKTMYLSYEWESKHIDADSDSGTVREFYYEFVRPNGIYIVESRIKAGLPDYGLYSDFSSFAAKQLSKYFARGSFVEDENELEMLFASFDEAFNGQYRVNMRYYQLYISHTDGNENKVPDVVNISKMKVGNLKKAMDTIEKRRSKFDSVTAFGETTKMLIGVFTAGTEIVSCLTRMRKQGVRVNFAADAGGKIRFSVYKNLFLIPSKITAAQMLDITGDAGAILDNGMWDDREFDFPINKTRYYFNADTMYRVLKNEYKDFEVKEVLDVLPSFFVCDLQMEKVAFLDSENRVLSVIDVDSPLAGNEKIGHSEKAVLLRGDCSKSETADVLEWLMIGENRGFISESYTKNIKPNLVLPDQIPYYNRPIPAVRTEEFDYLRSEISRLDKRSGGDEIAKQTAYRNYFAKDVNYKLFGYGGYCPVCGAENENINGFAVKEFPLELISALDGMENGFKIALYMCANDACAADGWVIEDVIIGGMNPFMWLNEVTAAKLITPEFLRCSIRMSSRIIRVLPASDSNSGNSGASKIFDTPKSTIDFTLSPLMAAKWVEDNI
ncbi:MAG: hypothetical protein FWF82_00160 [Oscillospiraceae bacterium]|nr:hypothetical protein [Oscillospiraceae bacterium]